MNCVNVLTKRLLWKLCCRLMLFHWQRKANTREIRRAHATGWVLLGSGTTVP